jgi:hypothetical protein
MAPNNQSKKITRREALKALTAAGGAVLTGAMLPDKWAKPVVGSGVLPAHAQASASFILVECEFYQSDSYPINFRALISPVEANISLTCAWSYTPYANGVSGDQIEPAGTFTVTTNSEGFAFVNLPFSWNDMGYLYGKFSATWSFTNPLEGTGTCLVEYEIIQQ